MLVMHFGHRVPEMHSHDATSYYAAIRPASAASHPYAVRHRSHNDYTPGCVACFARTTPGYRGLLDLAFGSPCLVVSVLFSKNFPDMFLRIQLWAVTWQVVQSHLVAWILHEVCDRFTLVIRSAIENENQIAIGRSTKGHQESTKSLLREIIQLHPIAKSTPARDCAEGFDAFVAPKGAALRWLSNTRPGALHGALRRQRHFIFKEDRGGSPACVSPNLRLDFGFPAVVRGSVGQRQHALGFLNTEATRAQQLGHVVGVVADTKMRADDRGHTSRIPQVVREAASQCPSIYQILKQQQFFFRQLCRTPRTRFRQQAFITFTLEGANPVGDGAAGDAQTGCHFPISMLARNHNQTTNSQHHITSSEAFRFCRKFFQIAQTTSAQLQFFTRASHGYPPFHPEDTYFGEFA